MKPETYNLKHKKTHTSYFILHTSGFTLIEVLIFFVLLSVVFVTFSYTMTSSLQNTKINEHRILATRYTEELHEWLRGEKETDWNTFVTTKMGNWCFNNLTLSWPTAGACTGYTLASIYKRDLVLTANGDNTQVTVKVTVEWKEGANTFKAPLNTIFSLWE